MLFKIKTSFCLIHLFNKKKRGTMILQKGIIVPSLISLSKMCSDATVSPVEMCAARNALQIPQCIPHMKRWCEAPLTCWLCTALCAQITGPHSTHSTISQQALQASLNKSRSLPRLDFTQVKWLHFLKNLSEANFYTLWKVFIRARLESNHLNSSEGAASLPVLFLIIT